ncbi:hypothetical protein L2E82_12435 [Cichorium intybus]|uniref:Uncharacterized protein n=1 Tax=Cichorium intybus TaxID=13427 RepID=A0ACB9GHA3_CICIN|nr:hypothetical protein L2E82_12435 [Cichorium intybus]
MAPPAMNINRTASDGGTIILNKYQLTRLLGRGSFAKVYHGRYGTRLRWGAFHTALSRYGTSLRWGAFHTAVPPWTDEGSYCTEILSADRVDS